MAGVAFHCSMHIAQFAMLSRTKGVYRLARPEIGLLGQKRALLVCTGQLNTERGEQSQ
jgi:hypothetical protein